MDEEKKDGTIEPQKKKRYTRTQRTERDTKRPMVFVLLSVFKSFGSGSSSSSINIIESFLFFLRLDDAHFNLWVFSVPCARSSSSSSSVFHFLFLLARPNDRKTTKTTQRADVSHSLLVFHLLFSSFSFEFDFCLNISSGWINSLLSY